MADERRLFSLVTAAHDVEAYLPAFIESVEAQSLPARDLEVIAVDDGSTDSTRAILERWAERSPIAVRVVSQANAGPGAARNAGLALATGEWVSFPDADDLLDPGFLAAVRGFVESHPGVDVVGTNVLTLDERTGTVLNIHPRAPQFRAGTRVIDLEATPEVFPATASRAFFRLALLRRASITFDEALRPYFEDAHFTAQALLALDRPVAGLVAEARYLYRRRLQGSSIMQTMHEDPRRYTTVPERGYLDLVERSRRRGGEVPAWVQHLLIYDTHMYLREQDRAWSRVRFPRELEAPFHEQVGTVVGALDPAVVAAHRVARLTRVQRDVLAHAYRGPWRAEQAEWTQDDAVRGLQRIVFRFAGDLPSLAVTVDGTAVQPAIAKTRDLVYYRRVLLRERILWVAKGDAGMTVDGVPVPVVRRPPAMLDPRRRRARTAPLRAGTRPGARGLRARVRMTLAAARLRAEPFLARTVYRRRYAGAWVIADRQLAAGGNGEALFRHLVGRRDVNAWFVLDRRSPDWDRMAQVAGRRLVPWGGFAWRLLMRNAAWVLASSRERNLVAPDRLARIGVEPRWQVGVLGEGVLAVGRPGPVSATGLDLLVATSAAEEDALVGDGTVHAVTAKEVARTGMPRLDRLAGVAGEADAQLPDLVLVAPDTRRWLTASVEDGRLDRRPRPGIEDSPYVRAWLRLLSDPRLLAAARSRGLRVALLPHSDVARGFPASVLPPDVVLESWAGVDPVPRLARTALLVTDYHPVAYDLEWLGRPVVRYQFDRDEVGLGGLRGRPDEHDDLAAGLGPVALDHEAAIVAIVAAIEHGPAPAEPWASRASAWFGRRDTGACERVIAAVRARSRPWQPLDRESGQG